jgi:hypothetical protein
MLRVAAALSVASKAKVPAMRVAVRTVSVTVPAEPVSGV